MIPRANEKASDILIIDDSDIAREAMELALIQAGFSVQTLSTPIGATRKIIRNQVKLVIIDINMPAMRGDKLAALFRQSPRLKDLKLVLISGMEAERLQKIGSATSADGIVSKSDGHGTLVSVVRNLLGRK